MFNTDVLCVVAMASFRESEEVSISATVTEKRPPAFPVVAATCLVWLITLLNIEVEVIIVVALITIKMRRMMRRTKGAETFRGTYIRCSINKEVLFQLKR